MTEFWGDSPGSYYMTIQSPTGEKLSVSTALKNRTQELSFVFVETKVLVNYVPIERRTGNTLIFIRFQHPASGIWKFLVEEKIPGKSRFHIWLPVRGMISDETYFLQSSPDYTVTAPGDTEDAMTVTAYQHRDNSLFFRRPWIQCRKYRKTRFCCSRGRNSDGFNRSGKGVCTGYRNKSCSRTDGRDRSTPF